MSPTLLGGGALFTELVREPVGIVSPSMRLRVAYGVSDRAETHPGSARFSAGTVSVDVCPFAFALARTLRARPCGLVDIGFLRAAGDDIQNARTITRPWIAGCATGRLEWAALQRLSIEAELGAIFPVLRDRFYFDPARTIHQVPVISALGAVGIAVSLW
jgi:hypothetical protein